MERPTSLESLLERLSSLDEQIERLQRLLVDTLQRESHPPVEDLEQTLSALTGSRHVLEGWLELIERPQTGPWHS